MFDVGFPASIDCSDLFRLKQTLETSFHDVAINSTTILSTALNSKESALCLHSRLKLSAYERDMAFFLAEHKAITRDIDDLLYVLKIYFFSSFGFVFFPSIFCNFSYHFLHSIDIIRKCVCRKGIVRLNCLRILYLSS